MSNSEFIKDFFASRTNEGWRSAIYNRNYTNTSSEAAKKLVIPPKTKENIIKQTIRVATEAPVSTHVFFRLNDTHPK